MTLPDLLQQSSSYWKSCTIHAGVKLDVFTPLTEGPRTAAELAAVMQAERGEGQLSASSRHLMYIRKAVIPDYLPRGSPV